MVDWRRYRAVLRGNILVRTLRLLAVAALALATIFYSGLVVAVALDEAGFPDAAHGYFLAMSVLIVLGFGCLFLHLAHHDFA